MTLFLGGDVLKGTHHLVGLQLKVGRLSRFFHFAVLALRWVFDVVSNED